MRNDLVMQAVMAKPVLDHQIQAIYVGACVKSCRSGYIKGHFHFLGENFDRKKFEISCTYIQHIAFRAELFDGAPDGTEGIGMEEKYLNEVWLKKGYFMRTGDFTEWVKHKDSDNKHKVIIPRPTPEEYKMLEDSKKEEWTPSVGEECVFKSDDEPLNAGECNLDAHCIVDTWKNGDKLFVLAYATAFGSTIPVVQNIRTDQVTSINIDLVSQIKTEREKFINRSLSGVKKSMNAEMLKEFNTIFGEQFDNGAIFKEVSND